MSYRLNLTSTSNDLDFLYIKGDEDTDGSIRFQISNGDVAASVEKRVSGVWVPSFLLTSSIGGQKIVVAPDATYVQLEEDDVVYMTGNNNFNFLPQAQAYKQVTIKNEGVGTTTLVPDGAETTELATLTATQSATMVPRGVAFSWSSI